MFYIEAIGWWFCFLFAVAALGAVRDLLLRQYITELHAHQIGTLTGCGVVFVIIVYAVRSLELTDTQALEMGMFWLALALAFEFGFFHYVAGKPWNELLADYNVKQGRLLLLLWLVTLIGPYLAVKLIVRP